MVHSIRRQDCNRNNRPHLRGILQKDGIPLELLTIRTECRPFYALL